MRYRAKLDKADILFPIVDTLQRQRERQVEYEMLTGKTDASSQANAGKANAGGVRNIHTSTHAADTAKLGGHS